MFEIARCEECELTEDDGADLTPRTITPPDRPDEAYDATLCEHCSDIAEEEGNTVT